MKHPTTTLLISSLLMLSLSCIASRPYKTTGKIGNYSYTLRLDSKEARDLFENETAFDDELKKYDALPLTNALMVELSRTYSTDFATLYLIRRLYNSKRNRKALNAYYHFNEKLKNSGEKYITQVRNKLNSFHIVFVPGFGWKSTPGSGAGFVKQREFLTRMGINNTLIEVEEAGLVDTNGTIIAEYIHSLPEGTKVILAGASKGGLDIIDALCNKLSEKDLKKISTWINVGGILKGSMVAEYYFQFPLSAFAALTLSMNGSSFDLLKDISHKFRTEMYSYIQIPKNIKILHFVGIPFEYQVTERAINFYHWQKNLGPNDGLTTTVDSIAPGGIVIPEIGLDHFFVDPEINTKTLALALIAADEKFFEDL